jgi:putative glutamine amidotransferase
MKPIIGISGGHLIDQGGRFPGYKRSYVNDNYIQSVIAAGGVPYIIPVNDEEEVIREQVLNVNGLILSGGDDVFPQFYGEEPLEKLGGVFPERDIFDSRLIKFALELRKPIFAICRGIQILNVTFGGTLYQDLSYIDNCTIKHDQYSRSDLSTHTVTFSSESRLYKIFGDSTRVNSFHHQAIKDVAPGFRVAAVAKDGVIEAIEKEGDDYVVAVQWHPEMLAHKDPLMLTLFKTFVAEADKKKSVSI